MIIWNILSLCFENLVSLLVAVVFADLSLLNSNSFFSIKCFFHFDFSDPLCFWINKCASLILMTFLVLCCAIFLMNSDANRSTIRITAYEIRRLSNMILWFWRIRHRSAFQLCQKFQACIFLFIASFYELTVVFVLVNK